jgi:hypothetical protein
MTITREAYLMGRMAEDHLPEKQRANLTKLIEKVNELQRRCGLPFTVSSGYRTPEVNKAAGGATNSAHMTCEAVDIADKDKKIKDWLLKHADILRELDLWVEQFDSTETWVHLQIRPASTRFFFPDRAAYQAFVAKQNIKAKGHQS